MTQVSILREVECAAVVLTMLLSFPLLVTIVV